MHYSRQSGLNDWTQNCRTYLGGLTTIYPKEKTREAIWKVIYNRHCYATTDYRSILAFNINDRPMGSEITDFSKTNLNIQIQCIADGQFSQFRQFCSVKVWIEKDIISD